MRSKLNLKHAFCRAKAAYGNDFKMSEGRHDDVKVKNGIINKDINIILLGKSKYKELKAQKLPSYINNYY